MLLSYGVVDQLEPGTSREPATDPMAVGAALLDLLDQLQSDGRVVVLAIDDLHWADRPSSRAILFALRRLRADKVLTVVSARAGGLTDPGWARFLGGDSRVTRIHLGGLSSSDLTDLASALELGSLTLQGSVSVSCPHRGERALLPGVARRDRRRRFERRRWGTACASGAVRGHPRPGDCARCRNPVVSRGSLGAGAALAVIDDRDGRRATGRTRCRRCCRQGRADERRRGGIRAFLHSSAISGRHLRRPQPDSSPDAACACSRFVAGRPVSHTGLRRRPVQTSRSRARSKHRSEKSCAR